MKDGVDVFQFVIFSFWSSMSKFACSNLWFAKYNNVVHFNLRSSSFIELVKFTSIHILKLLFSLLWPEFICLDWALKVSLVIEIELPMNMTYTNRLLTTATSCTCGIFTTIIDKNVGLDNLHLDIYWSINKFTYAQLYSNH